MFAMNANSLSLTSVRLTQNPLTSPSTAPVATTPRLDADTISDSLAQALPFASMEFWASTEVLTNLILAGIFLLLISLHQLSRWLFKSFKSQPPKSEELMQQQQRLVAAGIRSTEMPLLKRFSRFQKRYIVVHALAFSVDILGAPYVYFMYSDYHHIEATKIYDLMRTAFLSTAICSGPLAAVIDLLGRRIGMSICLCAYTVRYLLVAWTSYLTLAQVFYGVGVSLLYSVPSAWMVDQHRLLGFPDSLLQKTYCKLNVTTSVLSILISQCLAWCRPHVGLRAVLCVGSASSLLGIVIMHFLWEENVGHRPFHADGRWGLVDLIWSSIIQMGSSLQILATGIAYALMDCCVMIFVAVWTPTVAPLVADSVFPGLMIACALGVYTVSIVSESEDTVGMVKSVSPSSVNGSTVQDPNENPSGPTRQNGAEQSATLGVDGTGGQWYPSRQMRVGTDSITLQRQSSIKGALDLIRNGCQSVCDRGLPLRCSVMLFQAIAVCVFFVLSKHVSLNSTLVCYICLEFCIGFHYSAFLNLKSQVFPADGRLVISSCFDILAGILNYVILGSYLVHGNLNLKEGVSSIFSVALLYSAIALSLTAMAYLGCCVQRIRRPYWHPQNMSIVASSPSSGLLYQTDTSEGAPVGPNGVSIVSLFFSRRNRHTHIPLPQQQAMDPSALPSPLTPFPGGPPGQQGEQRRLLVPVSPNNHADSQQYGMAQTTPQRHSSGPPP